MAGSLSDPWVLAIDFGTTSSVVAARVGERGPEVVEINGDRRFPSTVLVSESGELVVGRVADDLAAATPERALRAPKTHLGEPHPVVIGGRPYEVTDLVAAILRRLTEAATTQIGSAPAEVRLSYPATWNGPRRERLRDAATRAGIANSVLLPEPVAAAVTYAEAMGTAPDATLAIYDLGGGTFDTTVLRGQGPRWFEVLGRPTGDGQLGGELFDELLLEEVSDRLDADTREQLLVKETLGWRQAAARLRSEIRRAKETLSEYPYADLMVATPIGFQHVRVTREELEAILRPYLTETVDIVAQAVRDAGVSLDALDAICLSGGSSRTPLVEKLLAEAFPGVHIDRRGDPKATIAMGAALATSRGSRLTGSGPAPAAGGGGTPAVGGPAGTLPDPKPPTVPAPGPEHQPAVPAAGLQDQPGAPWATPVPAPQPPPGPQPLQGPLAPAGTPGAPPWYQAPAQAPPPYAAPSPPPPFQSPAPGSPAPGSPIPQQAGSPAPQQAGPADAPPQLPVARAGEPGASRRPRWEVPVAIGVGLILIAGAVTGGLFAAGGGAQQRQRLTTNTTVAHSTTTAGHTSTTETRPSNPTTTPTTATPTTPATTGTATTTPKLVIASQHQVDAAVITPGDFGTVATLSPLQGEILCGTFPRPSVYRFVGYDVKSKTNPLGTIQSGAFGYPDVATAQAALKAIPATVPSCFPKGPTKPFTLSPATGGQELCDQTYLGYADKIQTTQGGGFNDLFVGIVRCGATLDLFEWLVPAIAQYEDNAPAIPGPIESILSSSATKLALALQS